MKLVIKIIAVIFSILTLGALTTEIYALALICLLFAVYSWYYVANYAKIQQKRKELKETLKLKKKQLKEKKIENRIKETSLLDFIEVDGKTFQLLEGFNLILTSKNPDIVISRLEFVREIARDLKFSKESNYQPYEKIAISSLERYKEMYYDVTVQEPQMRYLFNPEHLINKYETLYNDLVSEALSRYLEHQEDEISKLKTIKGKINRYNKVKEKLTQFQDLAKKYKGTRQNFKVFQQLVDDEISNLSQ